jgi:LysR family transcriptional regulator for metE and metH
VIECIEQLHVRARGFNGDHIGVHVGNRCNDVVELAEEVLITYLVQIDRLDIYNQSLMPANVMPKRHKVIETTDIMLQMVASGRGVAALPRWLVEEYADKVAVSAVRLGARGIAKQIFLGVRETDEAIDYLTAFVELARESDWNANVNVRA